MTDGWAQEIGPARTRNWTARQSGGARVAQSDLQASADVAPTTAARRVLIVTNGWPSERHPEYAVFNANQVAQLRALGVDARVIFVNAREKGRLEYLRQLPALARAARDVDIVHCFHGLSYLLAKMALIRRPMVASFQNAMDHEFAEVPRPLRDIAHFAARWYLTHAGDGMIFKDRVPDWLSANPLARNIANGVDLDVFEPGDKLQARRDLGLDETAIYLLFVSSKNINRRQKRYDRFKAALERLRARHPEWDVREIALVNETPERVRRFYQAADAHLLTSEFEGSPNSVKEAMASGLPIVATDVGNIRAMTEGMAAAHVVSEFTAEAFCDALERALAAGPEDRAALRAGLARSGLESEAAARRVMSLYDDVIASRRRARPA